MTYVKADVPDNVHQKIRMEAIKQDCKVEDVVKEQLIEVNKDD